jgi:hypothetical protein
MKLKSGFATIPILIALILILAVTPMAIKEVQKIQNTQRRAAVEAVCLKSGLSDCFQTPCCNGLICQNHICVGNAPANKIPCNELISSQATYCSAVSPGSNQASIPCQEITFALNTYCPPAKPTVTPTATSTCVRGQTRCVGGKVIYGCINNNWIFQKTCPHLCSNSKCL